MRFVPLLPKPALCGLIVALGVLTTGAASSPRFPKELHGTWDLGPASCALPLNNDSDTPIRIEGSQLSGYENVDKPKRVTRVSKTPSVWVIATESNVAPGMVLDEVFVLKDGYLTITDGESARTYRLCR